MENKNIQVSLFDNISWDEKEKCDSLRKVYENVINNASGAIDWYTRNKESKKLGFV